MNYRHAFHAGNFVDVMKHVVLALVIEHLKKKDKPFRVIDTHAGIGCYDLAGDEAQRSGEAAAGIGRLRQAAGGLPAELKALLAPYLNAVAACNPEGGTRWYPGSPRLARALLRAGDRLAVNELHPDDLQALRCQFARDRQTTVHGRDAWIFLASALPPKERRGVILIDPPFERPGEFDGMIEGLAAATRRFATGIYLLWYPVKDEHAVAAFTASAIKLGLPRLVTAELCVRQPGAGKHRAKALHGSGMLIHNAPYGLLSALRLLLPALAEILAVSGKGTATVLELCGEISG